MKLGDQSASPGKLGLCLPSSGVWLPLSSGYGFYICNGLLFATRGGGEVPQAILHLIINFCNVTAQAFIHSLGEVVLFCLRLSSAFETRGHSASMANSGFLQRFPPSAWLESTPGPWAELFLLLRKIFCTATTAGQVSQGRLVQGRLHFPGSSECMLDCHSAATR